MGQALCCRGKGWSSPGETGGQEEEGAAEATGCREQAAGHGAESKVGLGSQTGIYVHCSQRPVVHTCLQQMVIHVVGIMSLECMQLTF